MVSALKASGEKVAAVQVEPSVELSQVPALPQKPVATDRNSSGAVITILPVEPVLGPALVAVIVTVSPTVPRAPIVNVPLERFLELSPKIPSPLLSNCTWPVLLVMATLVVLSVVTVLFNASLAVTVTGNAMPAGCGDDG